jgi:hypothetical protein
MASSTGPSQIKFFLETNWGQPRTGTLTINEQTITIAQDGMPPIEGGDPPKVATEALNFGDQALEVASEIKVVPIQSLGMPFRILSTKLTATSGEFTVQYGTCSATDLNYNSCALEVYFTPQGFGKRTGSLSLSLNGTPVTVALSGFGVSGAGLQGGAFEIQNRLSGKVLDVTNFSTEPGTQIQQWDAVGSENQKWLVIPQTDGYYKIQNQLTGQVLDVRNFSTDNGAAVQQWDDTGSDNQRWSIVPIDDQYYEIINKLSGKALDMAGFSTDNGAPLQQWQYGATDNQQWQFVPITNAVATPSSGSDMASIIPSGYVAIQNRLSSKVLDVTNFSKDDGTPIQQWTYAATENQEWQLTPIDNGYYKIVNKLSGKVLDVRNFSTENGAVIQQWTYEQSDNQLWKVTPVDGQYFKIVNKLSGRVLDMTDFATENGGRLQQWDDAGSQNQEWSFMPVSN